MQKTEFDKLYENPTAIYKASTFTLYQFRMLYWSILDLLQFATKTDERSNSLSENDFVTTFNSEGLLHISGFFTDTYIDEINSSIQNTRNNLEFQRNAKGLKCGRIANIHSVNRDVFLLLNNKKLKKIQTKLLNSEPVLWGSLNFNVGTQQPPHADAPWFYVTPYGSMIGMWIALEDVHPDAGPLCYVPKSHLNPLEVVNVLAENDLLRDEVHNFRELNISASDRKYWNLSKLVADLYSEVVEKNNLINAVPIIAKKGDVIFWHQWLVHGGGLRLNPVLTRKSLVSHWISSNSIAFDQHNYFLNFDRLTPNLAQKLPIKYSRHGKYLRQYKPQILSWD